MSGVRWFVGASEVPRPRGAHVVHIREGERVFRVTEALIAHSLLQWSEPVTCRLEKLDDGTYDLVFRVVEP